MLVIKLELLVILYMLIKAVILYLIYRLVLLIAILDGLIDTSASPKSQGVGNSFNLRKLQASEAGLAAIARAEAKGWTITSNV